MVNAVKTVSFYSFKGGAGRTVCTANVAGAVAREWGATAERPALVLDLDLDSAGLTLLLGHRATFDKSKWSATKVISGELALTVDPVLEKFLNQGIVDVSKELGAPLNSVRFVGGEVTGAVDRTLDDEDCLGRLETLKRKIASRGFAGLIIDSASGWQPISRATHAKSDLIVYCCRVTYQFREGARLQLEKFMEYLEKEKGSIPSIIVLPVAVPIATNEYWEDKRRSAISDLEGLCEVWKSSTKIEMADVVDEVVSFKWRESVLNNNAKLEKDEEKAQMAFQSLAKKIGRILKNV